MAKTLYFQSGPATTHRGVNDTKLAGAASWWEPRLLAETRGAGAATVTAASIAGTTVGIEFVNGAVALEWLTEPLAADFTIAGTISANLWGLESTMNDNTAINFVVDKIDGATGTVTQIAKSARVAELATAVGVNFFTATPTSTACKRGDRIRVRPFIDDIGSAMIVGTSTFSYNGPTAAAAGDSYVQFTENLTFEPAGDPLVAQNDVSTTSLTTGNFAVHGDGGATQEQTAQSFIPSGAVTIAAVKLYLRRGGTIPDNVVIEIQSDSGGVPSGTVVGTVATVAPSGFTSSYVQYSYACNIAVSAATYWVVLRRTGTRDIVNACEVGGTASNPYANGRLSQKGSGAWSVGSPVDLALAIDIAVVPSTYYLTDTAETINPGAATEKKALTTRGSGSVTVAASTAAGPTAGIQI